MPHRNGTALASPTDAPDQVRALIVEDDPIDAVLLLDQLKDSGIDVVYRLVSNESDYRRSLSEFQPDIVLSDFRLPAFSGERALTILREHDQRTPFVYVSGTMGESVAVEALRSGATDYILKNNMTRLAAAVRRALAEARERRALDAAETELIRAQRFETLAILAGSLGHDLRNILQPVLMASQLIQNKSGDAEIARLCAMVSDCTHQALDLVTAMLTLARGGQNVTTQRIKLHALLDAVGLLLRPSLPAPVKLTISVADPALEVPGNTTDLQQCLLNLALNAIQAMPAGGQLLLTAEPCCLDAGFFQEGEIRAGTAYVRLTVADTGIGMDGDTLARLFTPFFTTKEDGNGLGLVSCRRFVESHHGVIRVHSKPGAGARFELYLPVEPGDAAGAPADPGRAMTGSGERILVVSGDEPARVSVVDILELYGYAAVLARDTAEAALHIDAEPPQAVLIDRDFGASGVAGVMDTLRGRSVECAAIVFGAAGRVGDDLVVPGVAAHLRKPVTAPALLAALRDALGSQRPAGRTPQS